MPKPCTPPANLMGIQIVYCVEGVQKNEWVDLKKVHAISWCVEEMTKKPKGNGNPNGPHLPKGKEPGSCPPPDPLTPGGAPMCWWDGTEWVCGEAES